MPCTVPVLILWLFVPNVIGCESLLRTWFRLDLTKPKGVVGAGAKENVVGVAEKDGCKKGLSERAGATAGGVMVVVGNAIAFFVLLIGVVLLLRNGLSFLTTRDKRRVSSIFREATNPSELGVAGVGVDMLSS